MDYGDSRVCKTLAGQFESDASHNIIDERQAVYLFLQSVSAYPDGIKQSQ